MLEYCEAAKDLYCRFFGIVHYIFVFYSYCNKQTIVLIEINQDIIILNDILFNLPDSKLIHG